MANYKQPTISISTYKAEYIIQIEAIYKAVWICGLLGELRVLKTIEEDRYLKTVSPFIHIFDDNQEAIKLTSNLEYH